MKILFFGEVMIRLTPDPSSRTIESANVVNVTLGGSEANTAVALQALGGTKNVLMTALPDNPLGQKALRELRSHDIKILLVKNQGDRIGVYWVNLGIGPRRSEVIYDRTDSAFSLLDSNSIGNFNIKCDWFHSSGVTPAISSKTYCSLKKCIDFLPEKIPFSFDLNFRTKLWKWTTEDKMRFIYAKIISRADLITGNESDFQTCLGISGEGDTINKKYTDIAKKVFTLHKRIKYIGVSLRVSHSATRNSWSGLLFVKDKSVINMHEGIQLDIDCIVDRFGSGDCFTAGILHGICFFKKDHKKTIDFAVMLSGMKHSVYGDFVNFSKDEIMKAIRTRGSGAVIR